MATAAISEKMIRTFLMDKPELNPLMRGVRWSPDEINQGIVLTIGYYNETPPHGDSYSVESFPHSYTLLMGVCGYLLKSAAVNEASNNLSYNLAGVQVNDKDKADIFLRMGNQYWQEFQKSVQDLKVSRNISGTFGHLDSEFARVVW